jgi:hypothetical protein
MDMKYFLSGLAIISCLGLMLIPVNSAAQDEGQIFYSYGEVLSVMQDQILVREFDYQTGEEKDTLYYITADTSFDPEESAGRIEPNDLVDVEFMVSEDGKNIAQEIFVNDIEDYEEIETDIWEITEEIAGDNGTIDAKETTVAEVDEYIMD